MGRLLFAVPPAPRIKPPLAHPLLNCVCRTGISAESSQTSPSGAMPRIHETDVSVLDKTLAVNVRGVWLGTKHAVAQFLAQEPRRGRRGNGLTYSDTDPTNSISGSNSHPDSGTNSNENPTSVSASVSTSDSATEIHRGWIINLASILGSVGLPGASSYSASKGAVLQLTRATALEYARDGIHINALQPGFTDTHILENMYARSPGAAQHLSTLHPWGRTGRAEEIARAAVFLAGEGASWITGTSIAVDGGYLAQ